MTGRTTLLYRAVFRRLKELVVGLENSLRQTMSDFEAAIIAAVRAEFPACQISGCDFHFKQVKLLYALDEKLWTNFKLIFLVIVSVHII